MKVAPLRYHGSKWRIANWVIDHFADHYTYVEPYGGGAAVLLRKEPSKAEVYNDLDGEIYNFFRVMRESPDRLIEALYLTPFSRQEFYETFRLSRECPAADPVERARRLVVLSYQSITTAGLTRKSRPGWRCWAKPGWGSLPAEYWRDLKFRLEPVVDRMRSVVLENRDATLVMTSNDHDEALHYVDPPYVMETRNGGKGANVYRHEMSRDDHVELLDTVRSLSGMVAISGYENTLYNEALEGWTISRINTRADFHTEAVECLWINPKLAERHAASRAAMKAG